MAAAKRTKADEIAFAKKLAEMEAQVAAMKMENHADFGSGTEALKEHLNAIHAEQKEELDEFNECFPDADKWEDSDLLDYAFWESGIAHPPELQLPEKKASYTRSEMVTMYNTGIAFAKAFGRLDTRFAKRALLAYEMKIAYKQLRRKYAEQLEMNRDMTKQIGMKDNELAAEIQVNYAVSKKEKEAVKVTTKPCKCKSKCAHANCGCKRRGEGCGHGCDCKLDCCKNEHSYPKNKEGEAAIAKLEMAEIKKAKEEIAAKEARAAARLAAMEE
jgi:hypothetical protein